MAAKRAEVHLRIRGRVQGVGFRYSTYEVARRLGLHGWVRNLPDGDVEVAAAGDAAAVEELVRWCQRGPAGARVQSVEPLPADGSAGTAEFRITG
ncbi:MAG TPA: acylphosphatase [Terriglobales bacterium]|nr:acylphosphatase [Terriglobales bacterium]